MSTTRPSGALPKVVVVAMGSEYRHDDGAGGAVARGLAERLDGVAVLGPLADPLDLLGAWDGADLAVVADAVRSGAPPGTVSVIELTEPTGTEDATGHGATSTHGIGLAGVLRLARIVGSAPSRVVVVGIEGSEFGHGTGLSPPVLGAVPRAVARVGAVIKEARRCA